MKTNRFSKFQFSLISVFVLGAMLLAACSPAATVVPTVIPTQVPAPTATSIPVPADVTLNIATDPKFGKILVDGKGMTLYMFTKDEANKVNCSGNCLKSWPPFITAGSPKLGEGVNSSLVGTAAMPDGTKILTYNKMPLYYWVGDTKPGDILGQNVNNVWFVVSPEGKILGMDVTLNIVTDPKFGKILVDGKGMTLYMYTKDESNKSNCADACLKNWPAFVTAGSPKLGEGVDPALVGTAALPDGSKILTYNKMPLYYWVKDAKAGDTTGVGVGDVWFVVAPDGKIVGKDVTLNIATDPKFGKILVDGKGMTLYMFTKDEANKSNCLDACLKNWPAFVTAGNPKLGAGVDPALVGTATLADGTKILTYNKMPLYYWVKDTKAGDTTGQGVNSVWYVVSPDGKSVTAPISMIIEGGYNY